MYFKDVIGQQKVKERLIGEAREERIPHALMFCGPQGSGKLPLAIAYARYICCEHPTEDDACGTCQSCRLFDKYIHPMYISFFPLSRRRATLYPMTISTNGENSFNELLTSALTTGWKQ